MNACKTKIMFGDIELEVHQKPDGSYILSNSQVAKSISKNPRSFFDWINSTQAIKSLESLPNNQSSEIFPQDVTEINIGAGRPIKGVSFKVAIAYWTYWASKGNVQAQALLAAGTEETLTRLADQAFGVEKEEAQYRLDTSQNMAIYELVLPLMESMFNKHNALLLAEMKAIKEELLILRPAYEELQTLNKTFEEIKGLKPLLEEIAKVVDKPNQKKDTIRNWLKSLNLDNAVDAKKAKAIGRLIADWLKVGQMEQYVQKAKPAKYPEALVPLVKLATEYQLFHAK